MTKALSKTAVIWSRCTASLAIALALVVATTSSPADADSRRPLRPAEGQDAGVSAGTDEAAVSGQQSQEETPADRWAEGGVFASVSASLGFMNLYWNWAGRPISIIGGGTGVHGMAGYRFAGGGLALFADADYETTLVADAGEQSLVSFEQAWFDQLTVGPGVAGSQIRVSSAPLGSSRGLRAVGDLWTGRTTATSGLCSLVMARVLSSTPLASEVVCTPRCSTGFRQVGR